MKRIKLFEDFSKKESDVKNTQDGTAIEEKDIIAAIESKAKIYADIVKGIPDNDPEKPLIPTSIDEYGSVSVDQEGKQGIVELKDVKRIEY